MIVDAYTHILTENYRQALLSRGITEHINVPRYLGDMEDRKAFLAGFPDLKNIATPMNLPWASGLSDEVMYDLARVYNDGMAEMVGKYPDIFISAAASMPLNNIDNCLKEADRAVNQLGMRGIRLPCSLYGEDLDSARIRPLLELMAEYDLPVWLHPCPPASRRAHYPRSGGWEFLSETADAMYHLACSGIFEKCPDIKIVVHHGGSFIPYFHYRMKSQHFDMMDSNGDVINPAKMYEEGFQEPDRTLSDKYYANLRKFYADTALYYKPTPVIRACYEFYEPGRLMFGTDFPLPTEREVAPAIEAINELDVPDSEKQKLFTENALKLINI